MSQPLVGLKPPPANVWHMYRAMVGVGLMCGLMIVVVFQVTKPVIARKRAAALQAAIFTVLPKAADSRTFERRADDSFVPFVGDSAEFGGELAYAGYDQQGELVGLAIEAAGMGYQDTITVLWGYDFALDAIVGMQVLASKETPGLGDKIEIDPAFRANFERLDVTLAEGGEALRNPIVAVKSGEKTEAWQVEGITGATISSKAIASILDTSAGAWLPLLSTRLDAFRQGDEQP